MQERIYLDNASFAKPLQCATEAHNNAPFGNPSSSHAVGQEAREALEDARRRIAKCINAEPSCIYFVSTASEAASWLHHNLRFFNREVDTSPVEHHAVLENRFLIKPSVITGYAYFQMLVNNETGETFSKPDIDGLWDWVCDATSAVGHIPIDMETLGATYLFADGIKFNSVPGAAFLATVPNASLSPMISGGGQERGMRAGTENVPAICAMAAALEWHTERMQKETVYITHLRDFFLSRLDDSGIAFTVNTPLDKCIPHILNVSFPGCEGTALSLLMSERGVMCSAGAACSNGLNEPSHVLMAMFNDEARARSALRFSFSHENTHNEIVKAVSILAEEVKNLTALAAH